MGLRTELVEILNKVLDHTDESRPEDVAEEMFRHISIESYADTCLVLLREWVRVEMGRRRATHRGQSSIAAKTQAALSATPARSVKVAAIQAAAPTWLRDRVHVGGRNWKIIKDCTITDLKYLTRSRQQAAERNLSMVEHYKRLAALLEEHRVIHVGQLPPEVLNAFDANR